MQHQTSNLPVFSSSPVELDPAVLDQISGGDGPHGGWGMPSNPPTGNPATGETADDFSGPHGGWKTDGPHGGW